MNLYFNTLISLKFLMFLSFDHFKKINRNFHSTKTYLFIFKFHKIYFIISSSSRG